MASPLSRLPLLGEAPPAPKRAGLALAAKGFRPFFLLAGVSAALLLPLWLLCLWGRFDPGAYLGPLDWHAHEMVSGYAVYTLPIAAGAHRIRSDGPRFGLKVYGIAQYTSYMYPGGLDLSVLGGT